MISAMVGILKYGFDSVLECYISSDRNYNIKEITYLVKNMIIKIYLYYKDNDDLLNDYY